MTGRRRSGSHRAHQVKSSNVRRGRGMAPTTCPQKVWSVRYEAREGPLLGHHWLRPAASNVAAIVLLWLPTVSGSVF